MKRVIIQSSVTIIARIGSAVVGARQLPSLGIPWDRHYPRAPTIPLWWVHYSKSYGIILS